MKLDKVNEAYVGILKAGVLEDRREYDVEEFARSYPDFTMDEAELLHRLVQANFYVWKNRDDLLQDFAKHLAGDIQMEIDDRDIGANTPTQEWLSNNEIPQRLVDAIDVYRTNP